MPRQAKSDVSYGSASRERAFRIATDPDYTTDEKIQHLLEIGRQVLGVENAHLVKIDIEDNAHKVLYATGSSLVEAETESDISVTYCQNVIEGGETIEIYNAPEQGFESDPAYQRWGISCYIGCRIEFDGRTFGTVCFVDQSPRQHPLTDEESSIVDVIARWITLLFQRDQYDRELAEKQRRFELLVREISDYAIFMLDEEGRISSWNTGAQHIFGYESDRIIGQSYTAFFPDGNDVTQRPPELLTTARQEDSLQYEGWQLRDDGTRFWSHTSITALYRDNGGLDRYGVVTRDLTEQRLGNQVLDAQQELTQDVIDAIDDLFVVLDPDGTVNWVNQRGLELSGYARDDISDMDPFGFVIPEDRGRAKQQFEQTVETGDSTRTTVSIINEEGERYRYEFECIALTDDSGVVHSIATIGRDITKKELFEQRLDVARRTLRHNLRNDLTVIHGWAEEIKDEGPPEFAQQAQQIIDTTVGLMDLSEKTQMMANLDAIEDTTESVPITDVIQTTVEDFRASFPEAKIESNLDGDVTGHVPDRERVETAIRQGIENAIEHNPQDHPLVKVSLGEADQVVQITIQDDGPGIPDQERYVLETGDETPLEHGSGLGLWLIHWCVATLGGTIEFEDRDSTGTRIILEIPLTDSIPEEVV